MPTITHFDISVENLERANKFYADLFGWKIEKAPGPLEYYLIETENLKGKKGLGGGMTKRENPNQQITNFVDVQSIEKYLAMVEKLGGKVVNPKMAVPGQGYVAICLDTENNTFGLWQTDKNAK